MLSVKRQTKFSNHVISLGSQFGLITYIIKSEGIFYLICKHLMLSSSPFYNEFEIENTANVNSRKKSIKLKSKYSIYSISNTFFMIEQTQFKLLKKHFMYNDETKCMVTSFTGNHLFS